MYVDGERWGRREAVTRRAAGLGKASITSACPGVATRLGDSDWVPGRNSADCAVGRSVARESMQSPLLETERNHKGRADGGLNRKLASDCGRAQGCEAVRYLVLGLGAWTGCRSAYSDTWMNGGDTETSQADCILCAALHSYLLGPPMFCWDTPVECPLSPTVSTRLHCRLQPSPAVSTGSSPVVSPVVFTASSPLVPTHAPPPTRPHPPVSTHSAPLVSMRRQSSPLCSTPLQPPAGRCRYAAITAPPSIAKRGSFGARSISIRAAESVLSIEKNNPQHIQALGGLWEDRHGTLVKRPAALGWMLIAAPNG